VWATSSLCGLALLQGGVEGMMDSAAVLSVSVSESNSPCEDRHAIKHQAVSGDAQASCYGIFDGHGGTLAVEIAAERLLDLIFERLAAADAPALHDSAFVTMVLNDAFCEVDQAIMAEAMTRQPGFSKNVESVANVGTAARRAGCCALVLLVLHGTLYFAHVGDCRAVLVRSQTTAGKSASSATSKAKLGLEQSPENDQSAANGTGGGDAAEIAAITSAPRKSFTTHDVFLEHLIATQSTMTPTSKKRKALPSSLGGETFSHAAYALEVVGITIDHACTNPQEVLAIKHVSSDPSPIRTSENDKGQRHAPVRVAGTLSVTRALGDGYLKTSCLSHAPFNRFLPYITCKPTVTVKPIESATDRYIILATDGLWNYTTAKEVHNIFRERESTNPATAEDVPLAEALVKRCLDNAKHYCGKGKDFDDILPGKEKRAVVDDITVLVLTL